ncbi:MAG: hypothetical protein ACJ75B_01710 [Flavisolibacter sp.]
MDDSLKYNQHTPENDKTFYKVQVNYKPANWIVYLDLAVRLGIFFLYVNLALKFWIFMTANVLFFVIEIILKTTREDKLKEAAQNKINPKYKETITQYDTDSTSENLFSFYAIGGIILSYFIWRPLFNLSLWYNYIFLILVCLVSIVLFIATAVAVQIPKTLDVAANKVMKVQVQKSIRMEVDVTKDFPALFITDPTENQIIIDEVDFNDSQIAKLESNLKNINSKVDAYTLESVLLGALAFSGFLTIVASNTIAHTESSYHQLNVVITEIVRSIIHNDHESLRNNLALLMQHDTLFLVVMLESLICSVFFILVLTLRLRFSDLALKLDYLIRIMNIFNAKEEELINMKLQGEGDEVAIDRRMSRISSKITAALQDADKFSIEISPVIRMMGIYRSIGITTFYIILVTSGLYFSGALSILIFLLAFLTILFRVMETRLRLNRITQLLRRH